MSHPLNMDVEGRWHLPEKLDASLTPEVLERAQADRKKWEAQAASPFARVGPREAMRAKAVRDVEDLKTQLRALNEAVGQGLVTGVEYDDAVARSLAVRQMLAEAYALTGRFDSASEIEPDRAEGARYADIWEAVWKDDTEECPCEDPKGAVPVGRHFNEQHVWSAKDNREVALVKCSKCGHRNAKPLSGELAHLSAHRAKVLKAMSNVRAEDLMAKERSEGLRLEQVLGR